MIQRITPPVARPRTPARKTDDKAGGKGTLNPAQVVELAKAGVDTIKALADVRREQERTAQAEIARDTAIHTSNNAVKLAEIDLVRQRELRAENERSLDSRDLESSQTHAEAMTELANRHETVQMLMARHQAAGTAPTAEELQAIVALSIAPRRSQR